MIIVVPTVQHTGTRFVTRHLLRKFIERKTHEDPIGDCFYFRHVGQSFITALDTYIFGRNILIPLRRLDRVIVSWERRGKSLEDLGRDLNELIERYDYREPYYLPIDSENREDYLKAINKGLGTELTTDWPIYHADKGSHNATWEDVEDKEKATELMTEFKPFFDRFYRA